MSLLRYVSVQAGDETYFSQMWSKNITDPSFFHCLNVNNGVDALTPHLRGIGLVTSLNTHISQQSFNNYPLIKDGS
jgi:hypothetical protein